VKFLLAQGDTSSLAGGGKKGTWARTAQGLLEGCGMLQSDLLKGAEVERAGHKCHGGSAVL